MASLRSPTTVLGRRGRDRRGTGITKATSMRGLPRVLAAHQLHRADARAVHGLSWHTTSRTPADHREPDTAVHRTHRSITEARAYGLDKPFRFKGADIALGRGDNHVLRLVQWIEPYNADPAYPPPLRDEHGKRKPPQALATIVGSLFSAYTGDTFTVDGHVYRLRRAPEKASTSHESPTYWFERIEENEKR